MWPASQAPGAQIALLEAGWAHCSASIITAWCYVHMDGEKYHREGQDWLRHPGYRIHESLNPAEGCRYGHWVWGLHVCNMSRRRGTQAGTRPANVCSLKNAIYGKVFILFSFLLMSVVILKICSLYCVGNFESNVCLDLKQSPNLPFKQLQVEVSVRKMTSWHISGLFLN